MVSQKDTSKVELHELAPVIGSVFQNPRSQFFNVDTTSELAFGCENQGLPKEDVLIEYILHAIARPKDLAGLRIAVTAGPTQEALDRCAT